MSRRVVIAVPPFTGHVNPALAVAEALTARGDEVVWAGDARLAGHLPAHARLIGFHPPAGRTYGAATLERGLRSIEAFFEDHLVPMTRDALPHVDAAVRELRPDVMLVDQQFPAGALVARACGIPWLTLATTAVSITKGVPALDTWIGERFRSLQDAGNSVDRPDISPFGVIVFSVAALLGDAELLPAQYTFVGPVSGGRKHVDFPWPALEPGKRRILVTLGTTNKSNDERFFDVVGEALRTLDVQAILVASEAQAARAPANAIVQSYVPQIEVLAHVDGVVCHAGHNTVCETLARGLPLVLAPVHTDQPVVARQVAALGAGFTVRHGKVTAAGMRAALQRLLDDDELRSAARRIAHTFSEASGVAGVLARIDAIG